MIDSDSHEVRAVEMTNHRHGDGEIVPDLVTQLPKFERIGVISCDGAYNTRGVYEASASRGAALVVPPRRNGKPWKVRTTGAAERNESLRVIKRLGGRLMARDPARQVAEVQLRRAILNTFNALGMPDTVARV